jgi:hypothetical protein
MWLESAGISQFQGNLFASARLGACPPSPGRRKNDPPRNQLTIFSSFSRAL